MVDASTSTTMRALAVPLSEYRYRLTHIQIADKSCPRLRAEVHTVYFHMPPTLGEVFKKFRDDASIALYGRFREYIYIIFVEVSRNIEKAMW